MGQEQHQRRPPHRRQRFILGAIGLFSVLGSGLIFAGSTPALPPPDDIPEEILRTEIITAARSPLDGRLMTAADYAELQAQLQVGSGGPPTLSSGTRQIVFLLQIRRAIRTVFPFLLN